MERLSFENRRGIAVLFISLFVLSLYIVNLLSVQMYPKISKPKFSIFIMHEGYPAEDFYKDFGKGIEDSILGLDDLEYVKSNHNQRYSLFEISFGWKSDQDKKKREITDLIDAKNLPENFTYSVNYSSDSTGTFVGLIYSKDDLLSDDDIYKIAKSKIEPKLKGLKEVNQIDVGSITSLKVEIFLNKNKLIENGIDTNKIKEAISSRTRRPLGAFGRGGDRIQLSIDDSIKSVYDIGDIVVFNKGGRDFLLKELADIKIYYSSNGFMFRIEGRPSVAFQVTPKPEENIRDMSAKIKSIIKNEKENDVDLKNMFFDFILDPSELINNSIQNVIKSGIYGAILAIIVVFLILGEKRNTLIIATSIPLSIFFSFILMYFFKVSVNMISLGGMTLSVGMVIDSSIVAIENIHRIKNERKPKNKVELIECITFGSKQVRNSIISSTLTSVFVFLPISFTAPLASAILGDQSKSVVFALMTSMLVSLVLIPLLFYYFNINDTLGQKNLDRPPTIFKKILDEIIYLYVGLLKRIITNKVISFIIIASSFTVLILLVILVLPMINKELIAKPSGNYVFLSYQNSKIEEQSELIQASEEIEKRLLQKFSPSIQRYGTQIYSTNAATTIIIVKDPGIFEILKRYFSKEAAAERKLNSEKLAKEKAKALALKKQENEKIGKMSEEEREKYQKEKALQEKIVKEREDQQKEALKKDKKKGYVNSFIKELKNEFVSDEDWSYSVQNWDPAQLPLPRFWDMKINVSGSENATRLSILGQIYKIISEMTYDTGKIGADGKPNMAKYFNEFLLSQDPFNTQLKEIILTPNQYLAGLALSEGAVTKNLSDALGGKITTLKITEDGQENSVDIKFEDGEVNTESELLNFQIQTKAGLVPLKHMFSFKNAISGSTIASYNGQLDYSISFNVNSEDEKQKVRFQTEIKNAIAKNLHLPLGYGISYEDTKKELNDTIKSLLNALAFSIILIYILLVFQFKSFLTPLIILVTVPLGLIGVIISLKLGGSTLSLNSLLGTILLSGIVVNNAIILIDFFNQIKDDYNDKKDAILKTASLRFTPIIMTVLTTIFGMLPIALALGDGLNVVQPLGVAVSGGLFFSTFLTLFVIPILMSYKHK